MSKVQGNAKSIYEDEEEEEDITMNLTKYKLKHKEYMAYEIFNRSACLRLT